MGPTCSMQGSGKDIEASLLQELLGRTPPEELVPGFQKFQPGMPHAAPPDPRFSQQTAPPWKAREPAGAGPQHREPDGGCVSTRGQGQKP